MKAGDGLAADVAAVGVAEAAAGLLEAIPTPVWTSRAGAAGELAGTIGWACAAWTPAKLSSVTLTAIATQTATAVAAITIPGLARMLSQLARLIACEKSAAHVDSARRTTFRR